MGSLIGHVVPGSFFIIFATWWTYDAFRRYFASLWQDRQFRASTFSTSCNNCHINYSSPSEKQRKRSMPLSKIPPIEPTLKLLAVIFGMVGEYATALDDSGNFVAIHNGQHMTMFGFFAFNAIFELLYAYQVPGLPPDLDYLTGAIAFAIEGLLFIWHLHGRSHLDTQVHTFLVYAIVMCVVSTILEIFFKDDVRPRLLRAGFTLLQGTWFFFVGFILYPPQGWKTWAPEDHEQMMIVTMMFTWNVAGVLLFQLVLGCIVYLSMRRHFFKKPFLKKSPIDMNSNHGYAIVPESDVMLNLLEDDEE